jgi:hypothetical protein
VAIFTYDLIGMDGARVAGSDAAEIIRRVEHDETTGLVCVTFGLALTDREEIQIHGVLILTAADRDRLVEALLDPSAD